jgi:hypothetical protein
MYKSQIKANDIYISETISKLNSCLNELLDLKVKILVPSEDDTLNNYYINCYENLLEKIKDLLLDLFYINEKYFLGKLGNYFINQVEKFIHIIDMK